MIISSIIIDDKELSGIMISGFIGLGIIGFIMFIIAGNFNMLFSLYRNHGGKISLMYDYKKVGVPNNKYEEFKVSYNEICSKDIYLEEDNMDYLEQFKTYIGYNVYSGEETEKQWAKRFKQRYGRDVTL